MLSSGLTVRSSLQKQSTIEPVNQSRKDSSVSLFLDQSRTMSVLVGSISESDIKVSCVKDVVLK